MEKSKPEKKTEAVTLIRNTSGVKVFTPEKRKHTMEKIRKSKESYLENGNLKW
jgi:tellurite resistance protein